MSFDVLSRKLDVFAPHFLEASAGTGKTFAIEHLVTRLAIEGNSPLCMEQILVVTFTRAATRELKKRIHHNLLRTKQALLGRDPTTDYLKAICEQGELAVKEALQRIEAALINYDTAQIYTLHGFCHRVLNEFAFEAGIGFEVSSPEDQEHLILLEQWVKDHLKNEVKLPQYSPLQIKALLNKYRGDFRKMISAFIDVLVSGKEITSRPNFGEILDAFLKEIRSLPEIDKQRFKADMDLLRPLYKKMNEKEVSTQVDLFSEILESRCCNPVQFDQILKGDFFLEKMHRENLKVRAKFPDHLHYPGLLDRLHHSLLPLITSGKDPASIFLRLARDLQEKSRAFLESKEKFSPDELLLKVEQALQSPRFVEKVRHKFRAAIIDEFQDTDPVQWNIFQQLFLNQIQAICLVGDPKQSIYAFRNADVYTYLDAAKAMGNSAKKYLDTNYRSTAPLVEALNLLFSRAQGSWMSLPRSGEELPVIPVKSAATSTATDAKAPIQFLVAVDKRGRSQKFPTLDMLKEKILPFLTSEIASLHTEKGLEYQEIAILIKDRFQAKEVVDYLKAHGIPASSKRGALITDSIAYFALKEMLLAVCSPKDLSKVKAALAGPLIAWSDLQISNDAEDCSLLLAKAQMQDLHHILFEEGFSVFFQACLNTRWGHSQFTLLEEILGRGEHSLYLDLRKLSELIIEEMMVRDLGGNACLDFLEEIARDAHRDSSHLRALHHEEKGSVTVMTMHMSKGLEFDTVFALGAGSRHKLSDPMMIRQEGKNVITTFNAEDPACQLSVEEQDAEKLRQLYVALTRAKKRLYIPLFIEEEQKPIEIGQASPIELFFARLKVNPASQYELYQSIQNLNIGSAVEVLESLHPHVGYHILEKIPTHSFVQTKTSVELIAPNPVKIPACDHQLFSFTALSKKEQSLEMIKPSLDDPRSAHTLPLGSGTGHLLHLLFEKIFKRKLHHPLNEEAIAELIEEEMAFSILAEWTSVILPWTIALLKKKLTHFALTDVPGTQLQQEMEFFFPISDEKIDRLSPESKSSKAMMKGFCDLLFEYEGKYYLLDWKSNYLGPSDSDYTEEKIIQVMQNQDYFLQASIYAAALERFVKLFDNRSFTECFGGAIYYFVRGKAVYHFFPQSYVKGTP